MTNQYIEFNVSISSAFCFVGFLFFPTLKSTTSQVSYNKQTPPHLIMWLSDR